jgi:hypothetical protein
MNRRDFLALLGLGVGGIWVASIEERLRRLEAVAAAIQGQPALATISVPHNDSWLFSDNVDGTHPLNLRYVIASNVQRVVSARLSIHLAPYRTYNSLSLTSTGNDSNGHTHSVGGEAAAHTHSVFVQNDNTGIPLGETAGTMVGVTASGLAVRVTTSDATGDTGHNHGASGGESATHTHTVAGSAVLGVTEGATATGVTMSFDGGADQSGAFGGPFATDQIELNILSLLPVTQQAYHVIALQPSGLGRIDAHLRLSYYAAAGQNI